MADDLLKDSGLNLKWHLMQKGKTEEEIETEVAAWIEKKNEQEALKAEKAKAAAPVEEEPEEVTEEPAAEAEETDSPAEDTDTEAPTENTETPEEETEPPVDEAETPAEKPAES